MQVTFFLGYLLCIWCGNRRPVFPWYLQTFSSKFFVRLSCYCNLAAPFPWGSRQLIPTLWPPVVKWTRGRTARTRIWIVIKQSKRKCDTYSVEFAHSKFASTFLVEQHEAFFNLFSRRCVCHFLGAFFLGIEQACGLSDCYKIHMLRICWCIETSENF